MNNSKSKKSVKIPKILLVGIGRFGKNHFRILRELHNKKVIEFAGVIIRKASERDKISKEFGVATYSAITPGLLKKVDAIDIVTPPETHFGLVKKCLPFVHVFVEKPLTTKVEESEILEKLTKKHKKILAVGHVFRYHTVSEKIKSLLEKKSLPTKIHGAFINPISHDQGREPSFELPHLFDIVDYIWGKNPEAITSRKSGRVSHVDIRYTKKSDAHFRLGWHGGEKIRTLSFRYPSFVIEADYIKNTVLEKRNGTEKIHLVEKKEDDILRELLHFVEIIKKGTGRTRANASTGKKIVSIAQSAIPKSHKPKIAIIGGGIFGTSIAPELSKLGYVKLFEKNKDLMQEGTYATCFRHHGGYHYPRSSETVLDIQNSKKDFENIYKKSLVTNFPTYYALAKDSSNVNAKEFIQFCKNHNLPFKKVSIPNNVVAKDKVELCIKVPEYGYHYETLTAIAKKRLEKKVFVLCNAHIQAITLNAGGTKTLTYKYKDKTIYEEFDFVINATYANINHIVKSAFFEHLPIRIDLAEVVIVKIKHKPVSITIIDGPFATLIPTGNKNEFVLYHVVESILDRYIPRKGLSKKAVGKSNAKKILKESMKLIPLLKDAEIIESRIVNRGVRAYRENDDNRVADIIDHGFGCWSVLSGKIVSSVTIAKKLARIIKRL